MKHIGFIDYYLDEWHANNYPAWIRENAATVGRNLDVSYAFADIERTDRLSTAKWCEEQKVTALSSIEELIEKSDYIVVLSPDNAEQHERLSRLALMSGKPVYIDKTFSPDLASGIRMFELAERYSTPLFSSSALRFSKELKDYPDKKINHSTIEYIAIMGPGTYETYSVHQLEMIALLMNTGASRIKSFGSNNGNHFIIEYEDGRKASLLQMTDAPFQVSMQLKNGEGVFINQCSDIFPRFVNGVLDFFESGKAPVPKEQTLEIMAIREAGIKAQKSYDTWINVEKF